MADKKKVITSIDKLPPEIHDMVRQTYPFGWKDKIIRITKPNGEFFHAFPLDTPETAYLIKVQVKVDSKADLEKEEEKGYNNDDSGGDDDDGTDEIADDSSDE